MKRILHASARESGWVRSPPRAWKGDAAALEAALREKLRGEVQFDAGTRAIYANDGSNYRQVPIGVVCPRDVEDLVQCMEIARDFDAPLLPRGGGTSLAGQCCNVAVVLDVSRHLDTVLEVDPERRVARVEPGCVLDDLRAATEPHGLTFGPDPSTHSHCTLGGMIGNNSCGVHAIMAGRTADNVESLEVMTYGGQRLSLGSVSEAQLARIIEQPSDPRADLYRRLRLLRDRYAEEVRKNFPDIPRRVSGYNLNELLPERGFHVARSLVGSEGTCAVVLEASLRLVPWPAHRVLCVLGFPDVYAAADGVPEVLSHRPLGLEGIDARLVRDLQKKGMRQEERELLPEGRGWLLVELAGRSHDEAVDAARALMEAVRSDLSDYRLLENPAQQKRMWELRESGLGATARIPGEGDSWPGWEDSAVPPARLGDYMRDLRKLLDGYGYSGAFYGHFGDGCLHTRITFDLLTREGVDHYRRFAEEAVDLCVRYGGSLSGEHGDGQSRAELLPRMFGETLCGAFQQFKQIWDPAGRMNPGKGAGGPYAIVDNLRLGPRFRPAQVRTKFAYADDGGSLQRAVLRCVGVGKCRATGDGIMCPSFMATHEERHSTRGRARILHEMLRGDVIRDGWRSAEVEDALGLCLACKACKNECPVNVDMATYKAEFFHHHYAARIRPLAAYSMGLIAWWSRAASIAPGAANALLHGPGVSALLKRIGGIAPQRSLPRYARRSFRAEFAGADRGSGESVLLFPDTFNDFFFPQTLHAAARVLRAAGLRVRIPERRLCCGRPLYDFGMLDLARRQLRHMLDVLAPEIEAGTPVVGIEPSCVATLRDELPSILPHDLHAYRLSRQTHTLAEVLEQRTDFEPPRISGSALVQRHCHHASVLGFGPDERMIRALGLDADVLDAGCCGLAGSFGFERGVKYDVSMRIGERRLFPAVRAAAADSWLIADGFSCRLQIEQGTGRHSLHLAEVLDRALARE